MKKIKYIALAIITTFFFNNKVLAAGSISTSTSQVSVGGSFTVTASISGAAAWNVHVSASGPVSGCSISAADSTADAMNTSKSFSATCTATGTGTITVNLSGDITSQDGGNSGLSGSRSVTVVNASSGGGGSSGGGTTKKTNNNKTKKEETKSGNNNLSRYEIENFKISPEFDKNTTDYTLTVPYGTKEIRIIEETEDNKASVSGDDGTIEVKEGENKFSTTVTAEDGSKKTYNITITVESKPIVIKLEGKEYSLIKNKDELPKLDIEHEDTTLKFDNQDIPAYLVNKIGYMLVGLRDDKNNIKLYEYISYKDNEKPEEYHPFNYLKIRDMYFIYLDFPKKKIPNNYKKYIEKIGEVEYTVYKLNKDSKYSLIYCISFESGKKNIYKYNSEENTIQLYENEEAKNVEKDSEQYKKLILILGIVIVILLFLTTIGFTRKPKKNETKKVNKKKDKMEVEPDDVLTKKDIKKIEKDTKKQEKKQKKKQRKGDPDL